MGLKDSFIKLDNVHNTYYPGQTVTGVADLTLTNPKKIRGIVVKIKGVGQTKWTRTESVVRNGKTDHRTVTYSSDEEYFSASQYLMGSATGGEFELAAGNHSLPFTYVLPAILPTSFEGNYGHVRYTVKVTLDRPWKFDQDIKIAFNVVSHFDLNFNPEFRLPIHFQHEETFCCWCHYTGPVNINAKIPAQAYAPGQWIPIELTVENGSNVKINNIYLKIIKSIEYTATCPSRDYKTEKMSVAEKDIGGVLKYSSESWQEFLQVPTLPPSNLNHCSFIDIKYTFAIEVYPSGCHSVDRQEKDIIIGTIPLVGFDPKPPLDTDNVPLATVEESVVSEPVDASAPPTYESAIAAVPAPAYASVPPPASYNNSIPPLPHNPNLDMVWPILQDGPYAAKSIHDAEDSPDILVNPPEFTPRYLTYGFIFKQ